MAALRAIVTASVLVVLYFRLPFDRAADASTIAGLAVGLLVFLALMVWQIRAIIQSGHPAVRALESLYVAVPLFILIFASRTTS